MTKQLTQEQLSALEKYERFFDQAIGARYCSYPGQGGIDEMLSIWNALTGEGRTIRGGCSTCIFHLVVDLATIYYAQKKAVEASKDAEGKTTQPKAKSGSTGKKTSKKGV